MIWGCRFQGVLEGWPLRVLCFDEVKKQFRCDCEGR